MKAQHNPTLMIKAKFSNQVHAILEPNRDIKRRNRWSKKRKFTDQEKLEMIDRILELHQECSDELGAYQFDRRKKKRIHKDRLANGYYEKKAKKKSKA